MRSWRSPHAMLSKESLAASHWARSAANRCPVMDEDDRNRLLVLLVGQAASRRAGP
jgi:hypothetical protein